MTRPAEFSLSASPWQRGSLVFCHLLALTLLLLNRTPWLLTGLIATLLAAHGYWQWLLLQRRSAWSLRSDSGGLWFAWHGGDWRAVSGRVEYWSSWLLAFELSELSPDGAKRRYRLALWRDGYSIEQWRQLQLLAREQLKNTPARSEGV